LIWIAEVLANAFVMVLISACADPATAAPKLL
jgi:hypothetical protein